MTAINGCQGFKQYKTSILITHRLCLLGRIMRHHRNLPLYSAYRFYTCGWIYQQASIHKLIFIICVDWWPVGARAKLAGRRIRH